MLFIHQQIHAFLNLGVCKEYPPMAKPRLPKKNTVNETAQPNTQSSPVSPVSSTAAAAAAPALAPELETNKVEARRTTRKPEIIKTDGRATLIPINLEDEIRRLAYLYSERRGFTPGHETEDWLAAEHEVLQRYHQHSA